MMAIEDHELRVLLHQRNLNHIPHLIEYIMMKPEPVRLAYLAREMGRYHDPSITDVLSGLLYHEDNRVILAAIQGLQENGGPSSVLLICPFLQSTIPALQEAAKAALMYFGPQKILSAFKELPTHPDERVRDAGVFILSRMNGAPVIQLLQQMLKDRSGNVRQKTILAMAYQRNPIFLDPLREVFRNSQDEEKKLARKAIVYLQSFTPKPKPSSAIRAH